MCEYSREVEEPDSRCEAAELGALLVLLSAHTQHSESVHVTLA